MLDTNHFIALRSPHQKRILKLAEALNSSPFVTQCVIQWIENPDIYRLRAALENVLSSYAEGFSHTLEFIEDPIASPVEEAWLTHDQEERSGACPPSLRAKLVKDHRGKCFFVLATFSGYADKFALRVVAKAILAQYVRDGPVGSEMAKQPSYEMVVEWKNTLLSDVKGIHARAFWRKQIESNNKSMTYSEAVEPFIPHKIELSLTNSSWEDMDRLCRHHNWSAKSFLWACWRSLLWRVTGLDHGDHGLLVSGRNHEELLSVFGPMSVCVPTKRYDLQSLRFDRLVTMMEEEIAEIEEVQAYFPYDKFYDKTAYIPNQFEYFPDRDTSLGSEYNADILSESELSDRFELKLECLDSMEGLQIFFHYDSSKVSIDNAVSYSNCFKTMIEHAIVNPEQSIEDMEWLDDTEKERILKIFNKTESPVTNPFVHEWFEQVAFEMPDRTAIVFGEEKLSYRELNQLANRLARRLKSSGVTSDTLVGIFMERTPEAIIGILGVLKAGGAYVPLETQYPQERLAYMLEDSACPIVLTSERTSHSLPAGDHEMIRVDISELQSGPDDNLNLPIQPEDLVYVIYTSGSTGKPKGVMIEHQGLLNYLTWCATAYKSEQNYPSPVHSSLGFDLTVTSLFTPLISGHALHLIGGADALSIVEALSSLSGLGLVKMTPAHLEMLSRMLPGPIVANWADTIVVGGEPLYGENLCFWQDHAPNTVIVNEYGPTETVVGCSTATFTSQDRHTGPLTIGRPISNMKIHILDSHLRPVPVGVLGEIYIGGIGVARGYLHREDLTRERFIADPYGQPGARLYTTGDLGKYRVDGQIEYHGRLDDQVKIRGYRVELQEIEAVIAAFPGIRECVAFVYENDMGNKLLEACFVPDNLQHVDLNELVEFLKSKLPVFMVPSYMFSLPELPLTLNGKVDRKKLVEMARAEREMDAAPIEETSMTEEALITLYQEIIGKDAVSVTRNFFEIGGNSILAIQCVSRIQQMFDIEIPIRAFFDCPTIRQLASYVDVLIEQQIMLELESMSEEEVLARLREVRDVT